MNYNFTSQQASAVLEEERQRRRAARLQEVRAKSRNLATAVRKRVAAKREAELKKVADLAKNCPKATNIAATRVCRPSRNAVEKGNVVNTQTVPKPSSKAGPEFPASHVTQDLKGNADLENVPPASMHSPTKLDVVVDAFEKTLKSVVAGGAEQGGCKITNPLERALLQMDIKQREIFGDAQAASPVIPSHAEHVNQVPAPPHKPATASPEECSPPLRPPLVSATMPQPFLQRSRALSGRARLRQFCSKILDDCELLTATSLTQTKEAVNSKVHDAFAKRQLNVTRDVTPAVLSIGPRIAAAIPVPASPPCIDTLQHFTQRTRVMTAVPLPDSPPCTSAAEPSTPCDAQRRGTAVDSPGSMAPRLGNVMRRRERRRCQQSRPTPSPADSPADSPAITISPDKADGEEETCTTTTASSSTSYFKLPELCTVVSPWRCLDEHPRTMAFYELDWLPVNQAPLSDASSSSFSPMVPECQDSCNNSVDDFSPGALNTAFLATGSKESSDTGDSPHCSSSSAGDSPMLNRWWDMGEEGPRHAAGNWWSPGFPKLIGNQELPVHHQLSTILEVDTFDESLATNTEAASSLVSEKSPMSVSRLLETVEVQLDDLKSGLPSWTPTSRRLGRLPPQRQRAQLTLEESMLENVAQPSLLGVSTDSISMGLATEVSPAARGGWLDKLSPDMTVPAATHRESRNPLLSSWLKEQQQLSPSTHHSSPLSESLLSFMGHEQSICLAEQDG